MDSKKLYKSFLTLQNLRGEVWVDIPSLDGAYEISNYGRVKSLRRWVEKSRGSYWKEEKILKSTARVQLVSKGKRKLYQLSITVRYESKRYAFTIARLVYYHFVKKFDIEDRSIVIGYKDENPTNVHFKNLILTTLSATSFKSYEKEHRPREAWGNKALPVCQFDKRGKKIATYKSIYLSAKKTGIPISNIFAQLNGAGFTGGFIWRFKKDVSNKSIITPEIQKILDAEEIHKKIVSQYDIEGNKLKEFSNIKAAAKAVGVTTGRLSRTLRGEADSAAGFYWRLGQGKSISLQHLHKKRQEWKEKICTPVTQYDLTGKRLAFFESVTEAATTNRISAMSIFAALKADTNAIGKGFIWKHGKGNAKITVPARIKKMKFLQELYRKPISQYASDGTKIKTFDNLKNAAQKINGQLHALVLVITGKSFSYNGYYWKLGKDEMIDAEKIKKVAKARLKKVSKPVIQFSLSDTKIKEFESLAKAAEVSGTAAGQIANVAKGKYKAAKGFKWRFKE